MMKQPIGMDLSTLVLFLFDIVNLLDHFDLVHNVSNRSIGGILEIS